MAVRTGFLLEEREELKGKSFDRKSLLFLPFFVSFFFGITLSNKQTNEQNHKSVQRWSVIYCVKHQKAICQEKKKKNKKER